jgi:hypothetical protein
MMIDFAAIRARRLIAREARRGGEVMGRYHLDPRTTGTGTGRHVETHKPGGMTGWFYTLPPYRFLTGRNGLGFDTEAAALAAARAAAGFGHVAEQPCGPFYECNHDTCEDDDCPSGEHSDCEHFSEGCQDNDACHECAWPRHAHTVHEPPRHRDHDVRACGAWCSESGEPRGVDERNKR